MATPLADKAKVASLQALTSRSVEVLIRSKIDSFKPEDDEPVPRVGDLFALSDEAKKFGSVLNQYVQDFPVSTVEQIFDRVVQYSGEDSGPRLANALDVFVLVHPFSKRLTYHKAKKQTYPNVSKALIEALQRCRFVEILNVAAVDKDAEEFAKNSDCREYYLHILGASLSKFNNLSSLNLGSFCNNAICRTVSEHCLVLKELIMMGPNSEVTDLGLRYIVGQVPNHDEEKEARPFGCLRLQVVSLRGVDKVSLATLSILLLHLRDLRVLDHDRVHEALQLMQQAGASSKLPPLKMTSYHARTPEQCDPKYLDFLFELCPNIENVHLCTNFRDTFIPLAKFRGIKSFSVFRIASVENFDLPMMAFGAKLVRLELSNCAAFQTGTALHIRKFCPNLETLILDIERVDANSNAGLNEVLQGPQSTWTLQNQVNDLQSRLNQLQITMLDVMEKYGPMQRLETLHIRNLSMGSLLIILPFTPLVKSVKLKYRTTDPDAAPNLTDELFKKIFKKNQFKELEHLEVSCHTLSSVTANWFLVNCDQLKTLSHVAQWEMTDEEQVQTWRNGRNRAPNPVDVLF